MGNWRTVRIVGSMSRRDVVRLWDLLDHDAPGSWGKPWACLSFSRLHPGLCSLGRWPAEQMDRTGNLAERDYSVQEVAEALQALVEIAGSMLLKVHCGGEYESDQCVATISAGEGVVVTGKPEIENIGEIPVAQLHGHLIKNLYG